MTGTPYDQRAHRVRLEWGPVGGVEVLDPTTYAVVVDVLSFTTTVGVAVDRGIDVLPWRLADDGAPARRHAEQHAAVLALPRDRAAAQVAAQGAAGGAVSLSPVSMAQAPVDLRRVVLPSPNGATTTLALAEHAAGVVAASLRNRRAVAGWLADRLASEPRASVALVPAGERWSADGSLRPATEDAYGAGAVLEALVDLLPADRDVLSPEAATALAAWRAVAPGADLTALLGATSSGRELTERGHGAEVPLAAELDSSDGVPLLAGTSFVPATGMRAL